MKPIKYENLKACDIVFTTGRNAVSRLIKRVTNNGRKDTPTHVGIILEVHGQLLVAEMLFGGLTISSLEEYRASKRRSIFSIMRMNEITIHQKTIIQREIAYHRRKTIEYDMLALGNFLGLTKQDGDKYYCSEYIRKLLITAGIRLQRVQPNLISPIDLYRQLLSVGEGVQYE